MPLISDERGDTLIEVTFGVIILGFLLISCFQLGIRALHVGIDARQRTQAANLLQAQAEGLRSMRDSRSWSAFKGTMPAGVACTVGAPFHVDQSGGSWVAAVGAYTPPVDTATPFTISVTPASGCSGDEVQFDLRATWQGAT